MRRRALAETSALDLMHARRARATRRARELGYAAMNMYMCGLQQHTAVNERSRRPPLALGDTLSLTRLPGRESSRLLQQGVHANDNWYLVRRLVRPLSHDALPLVPPVRKPRAICPDCSAA